MPYYNVVQPCVVPGKGHYVNLPSQPIELDEDVAAPLVEAGSLEPYTTGSAAVEKFEPDTFLGVVEPAVREVFGDEPPTDPPPARRRGRKSTGN